MIDTHLFNAQEWSRYARHIQLPQVGASGQANLKQSRVLIVGAGGLGAPVSLYLAAAGIGQLTIIDHDMVELSNLQRQITFNENDLGLNKAQQAKEHLHTLNSDINIEAIGQRLEASNAVALIAKHDLVVDCTDNFSTRYLINDCCHHLSIPWCFASIHQFSGQLAMFTPESACFRCLFPSAPEQPQNCNDAGVLGVLPGLLGTLQATQVIKYLLGIGNKPDNQLLIVDALALDFKSIKLKQSQHCAVCHEQRLEKNYKPSLKSIGAETSNSLITEAKTYEAEISPQDWLQLKDSKSYVLLDVRSHDERRFFHIGGEHFPAEQFINRKEMDESNTHLLDLIESKLPHDRLIVCYCQSGSRSLKVQQVLTDLGLNAVSLAGGLNAYCSIISAEKK